MTDLPEGAGVRPAATFPDEPFACPNCGQMLAASVRVCPSCRHAVYPNEIVRPEVVIPIAEQVVPLPAKESARFSWGIFFAALGAWFVVAAIAETMLGPSNSQFVLFGLVALSSVWVYRDAREHNIPKPIRWGLGSLLLWMIVFPWYLSRRRTPQAECLFIEGEGGRVARTLLFILLIFFLLSALMLLLRGPHKSSSGGKTPGAHGTSATSGKIVDLTNSPAGQAARAPSEPLQT
ncbi:MAG: zinc ribbon domain-containing protein [Acidobacteria bacterium]|nr:zinc ribbon domain-containing protein [Acidobacteriota bacterium]